LYIISKCLLGENCKYNGANNLSEDVVQFCKSHTFTSVCPETCGGLKAPRDPAEIVRSENGFFRVIDASGKDLTENFLSGAEKELDNSIRTAEKMDESIEGAILKANSPSCGAGKVYDGSFSRTLVEGDGIFAGRLRELGIEIANENNLREIFTK
jgi:uncharacterized protein YbbK (DUF523 family)